MQPPPRPSPKFTDKPSAEAPGQDEDSEGESEASQAPAVRIAHLAGDPKQGGTDAPHPNVHNDRRPSHSGSPSQAESSGALRPPMMSTAPFGNAFVRAPRPGDDSPNNLTAMWSDTLNANVEPLLGEISRQALSVVKQVTDGVPRAWSFFSVTPPGSESPAAEVPQSSRPQFFPSKTAPSPLGFSFSPAGLLLPYHLGVIRYLSDVGILHEDVPVGGASAGSIAVACMCIGITMDEAMQAVYRLESDLRRKGTTHRLKRLLEAELESILPPDAHTKANARRAAAYVVYTAVGWTMKKEMAHQFESRRDFIECVIASCNIPFYFHKRPTVKCRGNMAIDGYFSDTRNFGCPNLPNTKRLVRVLPFSARQMLSHLPEHDLISPDLSQMDSLIQKEDIEAFQKYLLSSPAPPTKGEEHRLPKRSDSPKPVTAGPASYLPAMPVGPDPNQVRIRPNVQDSQKTGPDREEPIRIPTFPSTASTFAPAEASTVLDHSFLAASASQSVTGNVYSVNTSVKDVEAFAKAGPGTSLKAPVSGRPVREFKGDTSTCLTASQSVFPGLALSVSEEIALKEQHAQSGPPLPINDTKQCNKKTDRASSELLSRRHSSLHSRPLSLRRRLFLRHKNGEYRRRSIKTERRSSRLSETRAGAESGWWHRNRENFFGTSWLSLLSRSSEEMPQETLTNYSQPDIPRTQFTWHTLLHYALKPTDDDDVLRELYDLGRADAFRWACLEKRRGEG